MTDRIMARREHVNRRTQADPDDRRRASLTLAGKARGTTRHATGKAELLQWLDMLGLPPCERALRSAEKWKAKR